MQNHESTTKLYSDQNQRTKSTREEDKKINILQNKSRIQIPIPEEAIYQHQIIPSTSTSSLSV